MQTHLAMCRDQLLVSWVAIHTSKATFINAVRIYGRRNITYTLQHPCDQIILVHFFMVLLFHCYSLSEEHTGLQFYLRSLSFYSYSGEVKVEDDYLIFFKFFKMLNRALYVIRDTFSLNKWSKKKQVLIPNKLTFQDRTHVSF